MFPQLFGKYVLERELAAGGMARVYLATLRGAVGFEKKLVVKQIRPELACDDAFVRRFVEEAKTAVELSHPNIVPVYELGVEQGVYYLAMEFCAGITLSELLAASGALSAEEGAYLGVEICRGLDYAHRRAGIVHRDVTPRNVLIDEEGAVRLIDFGIAAPVAGSAKRQGEVFGSPGHMPPEQFAAAPLTPATDVFAVAVLLVEAWTGRAPFRRSSAEQSQAALYRPVPPIEQQNAALAPLSACVARALALDARERPAQAEAFARPLRDFLRSVDVGDVARRLAARVREARRAHDDPTAARADSQATLPSGQPATPGAPTRTFAARGEVEVWTRREHDAPPPDEALLGAVLADGPVTRKLPSLSPPDAAPLKVPSAVLGRGSRALWPGLLTLRSGVWGALLLALSAGFLSIAALRSPNRRNSAAPSREEPRGATANRSNASALPSPAAQRAERGSSGARTAAPTEPASASPVLAVRNAASAPSAAENRGSSAPTRNPPRRLAPEALTRAPPEILSAERSAALSRSFLRLTADPAASVSVQGAKETRMFTTPVRAVELAPGSYTLSFRSPTYGLPVVLRVVLEPGTTSRVHADFRDAEPRVTLR